MRFSPELAQFVARFQLQMPIRHVSNPAPRQAAVLIPIINRAQPTLLLTQRSRQLRHHAGQIAFPGGSVDPDDISFIYTALREAQEEVAIAPEKVYILGSLPPENSITGFRVTPILGILPDDITFNANRNEVATMFEIPLRDALTLAHYHPLNIHRRGAHHRIHLYWYQRFFIWGLTAAIIRRLALQISD